VEFAALLGHTAVAAMLWGGYFVVVVQPALDHELVRLGPPCGVLEWRVFHQNDQLAMGVCRLTVFGCLLFAVVRLLTCVQSIGTRLETAQSGALGLLQWGFAVTILHGPLVIFSGGSLCLWSQAIAGPAVCDDEELRGALSLFAQWGLVVAVACCALVAWHARLAKLPGRPAAETSQTRQSSPAALAGGIAAVPYDRGLFGEGRGALYHAECVICLEVFGPSSEIKVLRCQHAFHKDCLERWLRHSRACALCRQEVELAPAEGTFEARPGGSGRHRPRAGGEPPV